MGSFSETARYAAAVSGGRDSMLLLYFLSGLHESGCIEKPAVFHFNHNLRHDARNDLLFVKMHAENLNLPFYSVSRNIGKYSERLRMNLEDTGRVFRYRHLKKLCASLDCDFAVTAHHADDYLETVLMHMIRGGGKSSFASMKLFDHINGLSIFRPLISMNRDRIDELIVQFGIPFVEDESNASERFLRNRIRKTVLPELKKEGLNPSHLWKNFHEGFEELWKYSNIRNDSDCILLDRNLISGSAPDLVKSIFDSVLKKLNLPPAALSVLIEFYRQFANGAAHVVTAKYVVWAAGKGPVWFFRRDSSLLKKFRMQPSREKGEFILEYASSQRKITLMDNQTVILRGDGMKMRIDAGTKKIKKILQEYRIPPEIRDCIPILYNQEINLVERIYLSFISGYKDRIGGK